ncbi:MAG: 1-phosphofructokinase [Anaerococcus sp.]|nr:1-phosphofructokinase [Anaerococcus sp.]
MIYTLTLNPALDYIVGLNGFRVGETNRISYEKIKAGGKGINVSTLLKNLGIDSLALGFIGGFTGEEFKKIIHKDLKLNEDLIKVSGLTRINVKIKDIKETEINGQGPNIGKEDLDLLFSKLDKIKDGDYLFLSGSIPKSLKSDFYKQVMARFKDTNVKIILDTTGISLIKALPLRPYLIKPNLSELEEIFDVKIKGKNDLRTYAKKLRDMGAKNVIVSLGKDGAYMINENNDEYLNHAFRGKLIDSVGAGDSMLAGFIYGKINKFTNKSALDFALAAGSATAFSEDIARKEEIFSLYEQRSKK